MLFIAGVSAVVQPYEKPGTSAVRITRHWYAPVGGLLMSACGLYALIGFPSTTSGTASSARTSPSGDPRTSC
jgi:hypothetical protein